MPTRLLQLPMAVPLRLDVPRKKPRRDLPVSAFSSLPDELLLNILLLALRDGSSPKSVFHISRVCRRFHSSVHHPLVLRALGPAAVTPPLTLWCPPVCRFLALCALSNNAHACYSLGMIKFYCEREVAVGLSLLTRAASLHHSHALYALAVIEFNGSDATKHGRNPQGGVMLCARAAALGHMDALFELGHCLLNGMGVPKNVAKGRRLLAQARAREVAAFVTHFSTAPLHSTSLTPPTPAAQPQSQASLQRPAAPVPAPPLSSSVPLPLASGWAHLRCSACCRCRSVPSAPPCTSRPSAPGAMPFYGQQQQQLPGHRHGGSQYELATTPVVMTAAEWQRDVEARLRASTDPAADAASAAMPAIPDWSQLWDQGWEKLQGVPNQEPSGLGMQWHLRHPAPEAAATECVGIARADSGPLAALCCHDTQSAQPPCSAPTTAQASPPAPPHCTAHSLLLPSHTPTAAPAADRESAAPWALADPSGAAPRESLGTEAGQQMVRPCGASAADEGQEQRWNCSVLWHTPSTPAHSFLVEWWACQEEQEAALAMLKESQGRKAEGGREDGGVKEEAERAREEGTGENKWGECCLCSNELCGRREMRPREFRCCAACREAKYCSRACQARDWKRGHKVACAMLTALLQEQHQQQVQQEQQGQQQQQEEEVRVREAQQEPEEGSDAEAGRYEVSGVQADQGGMTEQAMHLRDVQSS